MQQSDPSSRDGNDREAGNRWVLPHAVTSSTWLPYPGEGPGEPKPCVLVAAFGGWQDAGGAATAAIEALSAQPGRRRLAAWRGASSTPDSQRAEEGWQDWHDLRVHRPRAFPGPDGRRKVVWPALRMDRVACLGPVDLLLAYGPEPDIAWDRIVAHVLTLSAENHAIGALGLGAATRDVPHTRPWPLTATSEDPAVRSALSAAAPASSGPLGFVDVVLNAADAAGLPTLSLTVGVPSYAGGPGQPVATLRLLQTLEPLCELTLDLEHAQEDARAWLRGADRLAKEDARVGALVARWESEVDRCDLPESRADAIAAEVERFLRQHGRGHD